MFINQSQCKKIILPAMTLMLCVAAIAETGYAYSNLYNESDFDGIGGNGCTLQVGSEKSVIIDERDVSFVFDTCFNRSEGIRTYTFNTHQNCPLTYISPTEVHCFNNHLRSFSIEADDAPLDGTIVITDDFQSNSFATGLRLTSDVQHFHLDAGEAMIVNICAEYTFSSLSVNDDNVDDLSIPGFTMKVAVEPC